MSLSVDDYRKEIENERLQAILKHWFRYDHLRSEAGIALLLGVEPEEHNVQRLIEYGAGKDVYSAKAYAELTLIENIDSLIVWPAGHAPYSEREKSIRSFERLVGLHAKLLTYWNSGIHPELTPMTYFVEWAKSKQFNPEWLVVAENIGLVKQSKNTPSMNAEYQPETNSRDHVSSNLAILNQAAREWWSSAERDNRTTHPNNSDVVAWLMQKGFSQRTAESGATIIRPEWAPTGRKPEE